MKCIRHGNLPLFLVCLWCIGPLAAQDSAPADEKVAFWVTEALREDPRVNAAGVDLECIDGRVTLRGNVRSLMERSYAELIAGRVQGIIGVTNEIEVQPVPRSDVEIQNEITGRLNRSSFIPIDSITVAVKNASAVLTGVVRSASHSHEVEFVASEVRGLRQLENRIEVKYETEQDDAVIHSEIMETLQRDIYLAAWPITVNVWKGVATLQSKVGNAYQRKRAEMLAWQIANVTGVTNEIEVEWLADRSQLIPPPFPDDKELAEQVAARLKRDTRIESGGIDIQAVDGMVTLRGYVPTLYQSDMVSYLCRDVRGVVSIMNLLGVRADRRLDSEIRSDVIYLFKTDSELSGRNLSVQAVEGAVTVLGQVDGFQTKVHAAELAGRVRGVCSVVNQIEVQIAVQFRDSNITERVRTRLSANAEVRWVEKQIKVEVSGGVVTLSGDVGRMIERREAGRMAFLTGGVTGVVNKLTVKNVKYPWDELNRDTAPKNDQYPVYRGDFIERPGPIRM